MAEEQAGSLFYEISADVKPFLASMQQVQRQLDAINKKLDENGDHTDRNEKKINKLGSSFNLITMGMKAYAIAQTAMKVQQFSEEFLVLKARVDSVSGSVEVGRQNFLALKSIAGETGASLKDTVALWQGLTASLQSLGATNKDINRLVSTLQKVGSIGGSSAEEMANAIRQFQQSIASGRFQAEEFNSIMEQMPELARQIAKGMGISMDELRAQMLAGKLDVGAVLSGLENQVGEINARFDEMPAKVSTAAQALIDELGDAISEIDKKMGASTFFSTLMNGIRLKIKQARGDATDLEKMEGTSSIISSIQSMGNSPLMGPLQQPYKLLAAVFGDTKVVLDKAIGAQKQFNQLVETGGKKGYLDEAKHKGAINQVNAALKTQQTQFERVTEARNKLVESRKFINEKDPEELAKYNKALAGYDKQLAEIQEKENKKATKGADVKARKNDAIEEKIANLKEQAEIQAQTTKELTQQEFVTRAIQSLGKSATPDQQKRMELAAKELYANREGLKTEQAHIQNQKALAQLHAQAQMVVNPTTGVAADPLAGIKQEAAEKKAFWDTQREQEKITAEEHQQALTDIEKVAAGERIDAAQKEQDAKDQALSDLLGNTSAAFGTMTDIIGQAAGKNSAAYAAMFAVSKGFALAQAGLDLQVAISKALAQDWPANMALVAQAVAAGGQVISTIGSMVYSGGRKNGGPVLGGSAYRVGEGNLPEIFKAGNGNQYMIPGQNGRVISNSDLGGAGGITQNVTFNIQTTGGIDDATMQRMTAMMKQVSLNTIRDQQRPNGLLQRSR